MQRFRNGQLTDAACHAQSAVAQRRHPFVDERAKERYEIEGVALRLCADCLTQCARRVGAAERFVQQLLDDLVRQRVQLDDGAVAPRAQLLDPFAREPRIGSRREDDDQVVEQRMPGEAPDQRDRRCIRPVQILDGQHGPALRRGAGEKLGDGFGHPLAKHVRRELREHRFRPLIQPKSAHAEQVWAHFRRLPAGECVEVVAVRAEDVVLVVGICNADQRIDHLVHGCVAYFAAIVVGVGFEPSGARVRAVVELGQESALADPGLGDDADDTAVGARCITQARNERLQFARPTRECEFDTRSCGGRPDAAPLDADEPVHRRRPTLALERECRQLLEVEALHGMAERRRSCEDLSGLGRALEARCDVDGVSGHRIVAPFLRPRVAGDDGTRVDAHVQPEREVAIAVVGRQCREHVERRTQRMLDVVLGRSRRAEYRHDLVTDELVDRAAVTLDHRYQPVEERIDDLDDPLGIETLGHLGEAGDIGEEYGDHLAFRRPRRKRNRLSRLSIERGEFRAQRCQGHIDGGLAQQVALPLERLDRAQQRVSLRRGRHDGRR